jgi:hypothetical protein
MAKRKTGRNLAALAALGAAYKLAMPAEVDLRGDSPRFREDYADFLRRPTDVFSDAEKKERAQENARKLAGLPALTSEQETAHLSEFKDIARSGAGLPIRTSDGFLRSTTPKKKGGAVKGWGAARGARKAKVY